ncbi:MAG TPA: hypothetical protein VMF08_14130 [Candidatus Sulfotelmatobacter sp.]|nr:hypothetical protein [Candidatus Sulfotelmatobacter sp.]
MLTTTLDIIRSGLKADPSLSPADRSRLLATIRHSHNAKTAETAGAPRLIRRAEVARRLSITIRSVDKLASSGVLLKRKFPGRVRASGFLESDVDALISGTPDGAAQFLTPTNATPATQ